MKTSFSKIISGTMSWGKADKQFNSKEIANLIHACVENNISTFDLADIYGDYTTEADFGNGYALSKINRDKLQLISKCGIQNISKIRNNSVKHYDYSKKYILESVENSLKNLKTDYLDLLLLHRPSPLLQVDEVTEAISQLQKDGKILDFGLSNFTPSQTTLLSQNLEISYNQIQFSATQFEPMTDGTLDYMQLNKITPMAWNPLGTVFREDTNQTRRLKKLLASMVDKYHVGADMILLAWILKHPARIIPVAGTANMGRIQNMHKAVELKMDLEDWFMIWTESMGHKVP